MILLDGPMGTELAARGVDVDGAGWSAGALESEPEVVRDIHRAYVKAGASVHRTNTFRAQPRVFPDRYPELVTIAVRLAREAGAKRLAGSLAPVHDCYRPDLSPPEPEARAAHRALAVALAAAGVDLLLCETFPHPGEAVLAVEEAVKTGLETWVALTAGPDADLMDPATMERAARDCVLAGASRVLVCCTAARRTLAYVERLARVGVPFGAYANAGDPSDGFGWGAGGAAKAYAAEAERWLAAGASLVGSCCGTGPSHIAALAIR